MLGRLHLLLLHLLAEPIGASRTAAHRLGVPRLVGVGGWWVRWTGCGNTELTSRQLQRRSRCPMAAHTQDDGPAPGRHVGGVLEGLLLLGRLRSWVLTLLAVCDDV